MIREAFRRFAQDILPSDRERQRTAVRVARLRHRIEQDLEVQRAAVVGSQWKGTAISAESDTDLFIAVSRAEARKWSPEGGSSSLIRRLKRSAESTYPNNSIRIRQQAVTISFEQGKHRIDLVPGIFERFDRSLGAALYSIPSGDGSWITTSPDLQKKQLDSAHLRSGNKLKPLVRMLKWWSASRVSTEALSSLYIEWYLISSHIPLAASYPETLAEIFSTFAQDGFPDLPDPLGISEAPLPCAGTPLQRRALLEAAELSAIRAVRAIESEARRRFDDALSQWDLVFNRTLL